MVIITKRNRLELIFYFIIVVILLFYFGFEKIIDITTFSTVVIVTTLSFLIGKIGNRLYNRVEDTVKLTDDYDGLVKRYSAETMITHQNGDTNEAVVFPVIKTADLYDKTVTICDDPEHEYQLPQLVVACFAELIDAHKTSEIYNNPNIRVDKWFSQGNNFAIQTGRTTYFNSMVTNRAMDYAIRKNLTIRELFECGPFLCLPEQSKLSNHLGFNGFVESSDGYIVFIVRGRNVSIAKNTIGTSVGASLKVKYALDDNRKLSEKGLYNSMVREIYDELSIAAEDCINVYEDKKVNIISAYRDLVEGGKPQLLFYAKTKTPKKEIEKHFFEIKIRNSKYLKDKNSSMPLDFEAYKLKSPQEQKMLYDGDRMIWFSKDDLLSDQTEIYPDKMIVNDKKYDMVPSASASVVMLIDWLKKEQYDKGN